VNFFFLSCDLHWRLYALGRRALAKLLRRRGVRVMSNFFILERHRRSFTNYATR
jgi:hypothetical protein